jgi:hypothetical protein
MELNFQWKKYLKECLLFFEWQEMAFLLIMLNFFKKIYKKENLFYGLENFI